MADRGRDHKIGFDMQSGRYCRKIILAGIVLSLAMAAQAADLIASRVAVHHLDHDYESLLIDALEKIKQGNIAGATSNLQQIVTANPNFRLAQLMYADLLLAQSGPIRGFGNYPAASYEQISALRDEASARWQHYLSPPPVGQVPDALVELSPHQQHAVVVDMSNFRLYVFENRNGVPHLIHDFYASIGKNGMQKFTEGDQRTPVGVYFVTGFINPDELPDLYGDGAFPIDYPNVWDRRQGRTGYGIWLHGTPSDTFSRPPLISDGCVTLSNRDLKTIAPLLKAGTTATPVILAEKLNWIDIKAWQKHQKKYKQFITQWKKDWESRNTDRYLSHYSPDYVGLGKDYNGWIEYKRRVNANKRYIKIGINDRSIFLYPGERSLLVVTFEQDYESDNTQRRFIKRQYWRQDKDGEWRIIYEGAVS